jgi:hypothetical protein
MLSLVFMLGSLGCAGPPIDWDNNLAVFAESKDPKLNDDNILSVGETSPLISEAKDKKSVEEADNYTQASLEWGKNQTIQCVTVKAGPGDLEFFEVQYQDDEGNWHTVGSARNHVREEYRLKLNAPIHTRKLRLKVPKKWDSRRIGGAKRRTRGEGGAEVNIYKKIRDIGVYPPLPPEKTATAQ